MKNLMLHEDNFVHVKFANFIMLISMQHKLTFKLGFFKISKYNRNKEYKVSFQQFTSNDK